jgi:hypothetical protein
MIAADPVESPGERGKELYTSCSCSFFCDRLALLIQDSPNLPAIGVDWCGLVWIGVESSVALSKSSPTGQQI